MSKRKIYVDFSDCGRGCMPSVYDVPNENTVEFEEKDESEVMADAELHTPTMYSGITYTPHPDYHAAVRGSIVTTPSSSYFSINTTYGPVNIQQIEELASWFYRETGCNPEHIATYLARTRTEVPF